MGNVPSAKTSGECSTEASDDSLCGMLRLFYNRRMLPIIVLTWFWFLVFLALAIYCGIQFFKADQTRLQIMYATGFICSVQVYVLLKLIGWLMILRNGLRRQIDRLEARVAECIQACQTRP